MSDERSERRCERKGTGVWFEHREYAGLLFEYYGPLRYMDGSKVKDFVYVRCFNDLGLRAYKTDAFTAVAKRCLTPYKGTPPVSAKKQSETPDRRPSSSSERIAKTNIQIQRHGAVTGDLFEIAEAKSDVEGNK